MKKHFITLIALSFTLGIFFLVCKQVKATTHTTNSLHFKTKWLLKGSRELHLPLYAGNASDNTSYDFTVDWGDGTTGKVTSYDDPDAIHTYASEGEKIVTITGKQCKGFNFLKNSHSKDYLIDVMQWGGLELGNAGGYFYECYNLKTFSANDTPNLSETTNMSYMFCQANSFNDDLSSWDVSNVTNMECMFLSISSFNGDVSGWDVSNVTNMRKMFQLAIVFNGDLSDWDVSNVTDMGLMFSGAIVFNSDLSSWDVSNVTNMGGMFLGTHSFNGDLSSWDVSKVTNMRGMFDGAFFFNSDLSNWDVSNVMGMLHMFFHAKVFNGDLSTWNTEKVNDCKDFSSGSAISSEHLPTKGSCFGND